jgi:hypothetical protein
MFLAYDIHQVASAHKTKVADEVDGRLLSHIHTAHKRRTLLPALA